MKYTRHDCTLSEVMESMYISNLACRHIGQNGISVPINKSGVWGSKSYIEGDKIAMRNSIFRYRNKQV